MKEKDIWKIIHGNTELKNIEMKKEKKESCKLQPTNFERKEIQ